jgi:hypothetical protein
MSQIAELELRKYDFELFEWINYKKFDRISTGPWKNLMTFLFIVLGEPCELNG